MTASAANTCVYYWQLKNGVNIVMNVFSSLVYFLWVCVCVGGGGWRVIVLSECFSGTKKTTTALASAIGCNFVYGFKYWNIRIKVKMQTDYNIEMLSEHHYLTLFVELSQSRSLCFVRFQSKYRAKCFNGKNQLNYLVYSPPSRRIRKRRPTLQAAGDEALSLLLQQHQQPQPQPDRRV